MSGGGLMVSDIFNTLKEIALAFVDALTGVFTNVVNLIYTPASGNDPGGLTVLGTLLLIAAGTGLVLFAFNFIRSLIRIRRG